MYSIHHHKWNIKKIFRIKEWSLTEIITCNLFYFYTMADHAHKKLAEEDKKKPGCPMKIMRDAKRVGTCQNYLENDSLYWFTTHQV